MRQKELKSAEGFVQRNLLRHEQVVPTALEHCVLLKPTSRSDSEYYTLSWEPHAMPDSRHGDCHPHISMCTPKGKVKPSGQLSSVRILPAVPQPEQRLLVSPRDARRPLP